MRSKRVVRLLGLCLAVVLAVAAEASPVLRVVTDRPGAVYEKGETVTFDIALTDADQPVAGAEVKCELSTDGFWNSEETRLVLADGKGQVSASRAVPCGLWARVTYAPEGGERLETIAGAAFSPEEIEPSMPAPDDFDQFWADQIARLNAIPMNAQVERMDRAPQDLELFRVTLDNVNDTKVYGYLAKPVGDGPFPAMLQVQWAGVYSLDPAWVLGHARAGFVALNINAHAIENGQPEQYYRDLDRGALSGYPYQGREGRETSYFLRMYLSCVRAADYLASRPEWDRKHFIVSGGSQGGGQAFVTAGLCPQVTALTADVPALCDHTARAVGRAPGWPMLVEVRDGRPDPEQAEAARYFDAVNFARRVHVPALVGVGFADLVCPLTSVYAAYNVLGGEKQIIVDPLAGHGGAHEPYGRAVWQFTQTYKTN